MTNGDWADYIEWWETEDGEFNWHAKSDNGRVLFGSTQGYTSKATMLQYVSGQFPDLGLKPRDGEPQSSVEEARAVTDEEHGHSTPGTDE